MDFDEYAKNMLEFSQNAYQSTMQFAEMLDSKAYNILAASFVVVALVAHVGLSNLALGGWVKLSLFICAIIVLVSIASCIISLQLKKYQMLNIMGIFDEVEGKEPHEGLWVIISTVGDMQSDNLSVVKEKSRWLWRAIVAFALSVGILVVLIASTFLVSQLQLHLLLLCYFWGGV